MSRSDAFQIEELRGSVILSYEQFQLIPYDGLGHHLFNGVHIITPAPSLFHQNVSANLMRNLSTYISQNSLGKLFSAPVDLKFSNRDGYQPDIVFLAGRKEIRKNERYISEIPTLIIEITSPSSAKADYGWKKELSERYGVQEYWVVDLKYSLVEIFSLIDTKYQSHGTFTKSEIIQSSLDIFSKFSLSVNRVFE